jgi:acetyl-CoA carboxylase carboxyltransferase component
MGGGRNSDEVLAWPTAEVSFMTPSFATKVVHGLDPGQPGFEEAFDTMNQDTSVWDMASAYAVQLVIRPEDTRQHLIRTLEVHGLRRTGGVGRHLLASWPTSF